MTDFINDIELSGRARNVLRNMGVTTEADFMALTRTQVLAQKNAGARTWREVAEVQQGLREVQKRRRQQMSGGPAYPLHGFDGHRPWPGMTLRDAAALAALPNIVALALSTTLSDTREGETRGEWAARQTWEMADAFMAARETKET